MLPELGIERVDLLMMNIEGAETDALRGASGLMGSIRNSVISCHDSSPATTCRAMRTKADVRALLEDAGFEVTQQEHRHPWVRDTLYASRPAAA